MISSRLTSTKPFGFIVRRWLENSGWYLILIVVALVTALPFLWTGLMSVRENSAQIFRAGKTPQLIPYPGLIGWGEGADHAQESGHYESPEGYWHDYQPQFEASLSESTLAAYFFPATTANYYRVWVDVKLPQYFGNSLIVSISTVVLNLLTCSLAAYPLAKLRFKGKNFIFSAILATLIFPEQLILIPLYIMAVKVFGFQDTLYSLILPFSTSAFGIFLLRQIYQSIPDELLEAARLDGASEFGIWWRVLLPLIRPGLATLTIITFITSWNSFLWPYLMLNNTSLFTLPIGLKYLEGFFSGNLRTIAAGIIIATVPMIAVFLIFQKQFIRGLSGAVKG
jgi:putative chitobiose transport system permease protein